MLSKHIDEKCEWKTNEINSMKCAENRIKCAEIIVSMYLYKMLKKSNVRDKNCIIQVG